MESLQATPASLSVGTAGAAIATARAGLGVTLVHEVAAQRELADGQLRVYPVPGTPLQRPWMLSVADRAAGVTRLWLDHVTDPDRVGAHAFQPGAR